MSKEIVSNILREARPWRDATKVKPDPGQLVVIRITNPDIIYVETETEILPSEDMKIAKFNRNQDGVNGIWVIEPPYPKFDYSPLSNKEQLYPGTMVTHWAVPEEGEIEGWKTRFNPSGIYKKLNIEVDDDHLELVYRALIWASAYIQKANPDDPDAKRLASVLYDLQYVLDTGKPIELSDEEYEKQIAERKQLIEKMQEERVNKAINELEREGKGDKP